MAIKILTKDTDIHFPHFTVLKASAGSGKTYTLAERFVQFIFSEKISRNDLRNILAITFTNNSAREMKERILSWLKSVYFNDHAFITELSRIVSLDRNTMIEKAGYLINAILDNYSDFQVKTIDSFMTTVFKASAIDFGYNPDFDILINKDTLMKYAFDLFLRNVREGTKEARLFKEIISIILEHKKMGASYLWDPSSALLDEIKKIYTKISSTGSEPKIVNLSGELSAVKDKIQATIEMIEDLITKSGLERRSTSSYGAIRSLVRARRFVDLIGKGTKNPPVTKPKSHQRSAQKTYELICERWEECGRLINQYIALSIRSYYTPYVQVYSIFREAIEAIKKQQGKIFIEDINWNLSEYLNSSIVPDIYFRIGETIYHFFIDEFQDTSPIQWKNLFPLLENSLSQTGSVFLVGDTKQAIYGFRDADYTIMKAFESENPFPSAQHIVKELDTNYRSLKKILAFNEKVFKDIVALNEKYHEAGSRSGLTDYVQNVWTEHKKPGYVEVTILDREDEAPPERQRIQNLIIELSSRGFTYRDIAVLTQKNEDAINVTTWLNEKSIPFISYSSLDIRRRKITGEIVSLLNFLNSPPDNRSFATFILGDIFTGNLAQNSIGIDIRHIRDFLFTFRDNSPLYKSFQHEFPVLWDTYFSGLFKSSGYFPLYDLVVQIFHVFRVFELAKDEEATLAKFLEAVKDCEGAGYNSIRDFLDFAGNRESDETEWTMNIPKDIDAVNVMTIHKAKGLGFPVVIVLLYEVRSRGFDYIVEEDRDGVCLLKITKATMSSDPSFETLYHEETTREIVNRLNSLYVGFTRSEEELYVIAVQGKYTGYPFDLMPVAEYPPSQKPERLPRKSADAFDTISVRHHHTQIEFPTTSEEVLNIEERRRGEFIHRVLSFIEYADEEFPERLSEIIKKVNDETSAEYAVDEIIPVITGMIVMEAVAEYFQKKPNRVIMREQEFSDRKGNLFRMDRVIVDYEKITVLDYKTGSDRDAEAKHQRQMETYIRVLDGIYTDKPVQGLITYIDLREVRKIP